MRHRNVCFQVYNKSKEIVIFFIQMNLVVKNNFRTSLNLG